MTSPHHSLVFLTSLLEALFIKSVPSESLGLFAALALQAINPEGRCWASRCASAVIEPFGSIWFYHIDIY